MGQWLVLVDAQDCFDPTSMDQELLSRLLWVRCRNVQQALKATDLLLRDQNLPFVVLDFQLVPVAQLRKIPATVWHRFQRLLDYRAATLVVFAPQRQVSGPQCRVFLRNRFDLEALHLPQAELLTRFQVEVTRLDGKESGAGPEKAGQMG
jgi:hypothetical protein